MVYWITGLSGAGKTTIGKELYSKLKPLNEGLVFLDGDVLRNVFGDTYGYSYDDRFKLAMIYSRICKMLSNQGLMVICCTISMFDDVREWNRDNISDYMEIYLRVPLDILKQRNQKGLYENIDKENTLDLVGVNINFQEPKNPDIIIDNDGSFSISECVTMIIEYKKDIAFYEDKTYWDNYYGKTPPTTNNSLFSEYIMRYVESGKNIVDLGCGNGRDTIFFMNHGLYIWGIDGSEVTIHKLKQSYGYNSKINLVCGDFVDSKSIYNKMYNYFYSRFSIHSINDEKQHILLRNIYQHLKPEGYLFIEARGIHDELYGKGLEVERNAYIYNEHYRRFIVISEIESELKDIGFSIIYSVESRGFAPSDKEDPLIIRIIAQKYS